MGYPFIYVETEKLQPDEAFTAEVLRKAQDLLDDDFAAQEATGWISNADVLRVVKTQVWLAMHALERARRPSQVH